MLQSIIIEICSCASVSHVQSTRTDRILIANKREETKNTSMKFPLSVFFMSITFSIALPLLDMFSDWFLFHNTITFKGNSVAMAACRSCYMGTENYKDRPTQTECDVCVSSSKFGGFGGGIHCGLSLFALDTMTEMLEDHSCLPNGTVLGMYIDNPNNITI